MRRFLLALSDSSTDTAVMILHTAKPVDANFDLVEKVTSFISGFRNFETFVRIGISENLSYAEEGASGYRCTNEHISLLFSIDLTNAGIFRVS